MKLERFDKYTSGIICDCGGRARPRIRSSMEQNADMIVLCDECGETEMLSHIMGMDKPYN